MNSQKHLFSLQEGIHYLNCAYKAPLLKKGEEACAKSLIASRNPFNLSVDDFFDTTEEIKRQFGQLIHADAGDVVLVSSTSYAFTSVLNNTPAKPHGHALTLEHEFPSGYYSLSRWCEEHSQNLKSVGFQEREAGESPTTHLLNSITSETSVVLMSSVHWMNGMRFELEGIGKRCKEVGAVFIVDGTQSVGAQPIDVKACHIDALVCASYKWLFGPYSMAVAYIAPRFHGGKPVEEPWINRSNAREFQNLTQYVADYRPAAARFNGGETSNFILSPILLEALRQVNAWTPEAISAYARRLSAPLFELLQSAGIQSANREEYANHIFPLTLPSHVDHEHLKKLLNENQIFISLRGQHIRVSVNVFNEEADIEKLVEVVQQVL
ncbi:MAG: aminotransferase class V-fold PLP-dependent enzyme [Flavobacteriales bacterium]|nr:aminotransferase class V-fold PLP-dependent enzyme [Flavobacteriales bacterium]